MANRELIELDLDEYVEGESWPEELEDGAPGPLADEEALQGVLRRLKRLDREAATVTDVAKVEVERITGWRDDRLAGIAKQRAYGERAVEAYTRGRAAANPRAKKSVSLPDGTAKLSKPQEKVEVVDEATFLAWAVEQGTDELADGTVVDIITVHHPALVRVTFAPVKDALKALDHGAEETADGITSAGLALPGGELVPGVEVRRPAQDNFKVTLTAD